MEYVGGGSLADRLDGTPRPTRDASALLETVARAIHEAHRQGVIHRDIKPSNILLMPDGAPKIVDFGLAKLVGSDSGLTRTDAVLGSPAYMAPEQAAGLASAVGPAADVYALGVVFYEMLTGRQPFVAGTTLEALDLVRHAEPVAPSRLRPGLPRDLETICLRCLAKDPGRRHPSAEALADDLGRWLRGESILARPTGLLERGYRWSLRNRAVAGLLASIALLLVGRGLARSIDITPVAVPARVASKASRTIAFAPDGRLLLSSGTDGVARLLSTADLGTVGWPISHPSQNLVAAFSPDGGRVATGARDTTIRIWDAEGLPVLPPIPVGHWVSALRFSPDGRRLLAADETGQVRLIDAASGETLAPPQVHTPKFEGSHVGSVFFSPDGLALYRAGQSQAAIDRLTSPLGDRRLDEYDEARAILAMAHRRLGRPVEARAWLRLLLDEPPSKSVPEKLHRFALAREAEEVVLDSGFPPDPFGSPE